MDSMVADQDLCTQLNNCVSIDAIAHIAAQFHCQESTVNGRDRQR